MASGNNGGHKGTQNLKPWVKGQSGNPSGRSSARQALTRALEGDWQLAHRRLKELLFSDDDKVALEAAKFYIDHIKGKAKQAITGEDGGPLQVDLGVVEMLRKLAGP